MSLAKEAAQSEEEKRRKQRESYRRNRQQRLRQQKAWRLANKEKIRFRKKRYRRQLAAGARVPKKRARAGLSYQFLGAHPPVGTEETTPTADMVESKEKRF